MNSSIQIELHRDHRAIVAIVTWPSGPSIKLTPTNTSDKENLMPKYMLLLHDNPAAFANVSPDADAEGRREIHRVGKQAA